MGRGCCAGLEMQQTLVALVPSYCVTLKPLPGVNANRLIELGARVVVKDEPSTATIVT